MQKTRRILAIAVLCLIVIFFLKDQVIKGIVSMSAAGVTGTNVQIGGISFGVFNHAVRIKNFKLDHPKGFPMGILIDIPAINIDYDLSAILSGKLHLNRMVVDLKEATIIKNKEGKLNVDALKVAKKENAPASSQKGKSSESLPMKIDTVTLSIGKVVYKDYSEGDKPFIQVYDVGIKDRAYKNITSAQQFVSLVFVEAMRPTAIKNAVIYEAASLAGMAFLPVGIATALTAKDSAEGHFHSNFDRVYQMSLAVLKDIGRIKEEDKEKGIIKGEVNSYDVALKVSKSTAKTIQISVSARNYLIPQPQVAGGILYQISEKLQ